jgi:acyl carrier protein
MKLYDIIADTFNIDKSIINDTMIVTDLETWDSMAHMLFITRIEESYEIELTGNEIAKLLSVSEIKDVLKEKGKLD